MEEYKEFEYKSTFSYWTFMPAIIFGALTLYCFYYNAGIAIKGKSIISSPYSYYILGVLFISFLIYSIYKLKAHKTAIQNKNTIKISQTTISFPHKTTQVILSFKDISKLYIKDDSDDGESIIIYTNDNKDRFEFFHDNFISSTAYIEFKISLEKLCINVSST
ncbi:MULTISPECIES: hypothetical protein [Aquimarina]|uniref:hypothetical protein n=1 Tax=Aquimarina TaxID=290174 RepID=UPI000D686CD5|nr:MULTISPECIES: hypothetical protein [Aquimarina]